MPLRIKEFSYQEVELYVKSLFMRERNQNAKDKYIGVAVSNIMSFIIIILLPLVMGSLIEIIGINEGCIIIFIIINSVYIIMSYFKYKVMNVNMFLCIIETFLSLIGILFYIMFANTFIQGFPVILIMVYLLFPYCIRCYQIAQKYNVSPI